MQNFWPPFVAIFVVILPLFMRFLDDVSSCLLWFGKYGRVMGKRRGSPGCEWAHPDLPVHCFGGVFPGLD